MYVSEVAVSGLGVRKNQGRHITDNRARDGGEIGREREGGDNNIKRGGRNRKNGKTKSRGCRKREGRKRSKRRRDREAKTGSKQYNRKVKRERGLEIGLRRKKKER